ncbi:unnamed protein product [Paramecium primaurelia]|uniref:Uncharacterized protein n=1 Tax=Paramecium primaurelia TaxID=5886 RepID=A0A8S1P397_PARPR|nr:unnamed protein product [Paramecium primaurelia]
MSFSNSSISMSTSISQSSLQQIQHCYDEELELQELEAQKEIFAQMFEANYNTTSMLIETVQESVVFNKSKKLRILKRKLRKLIRNQIRRRRGVGNYIQEMSLVGTTQLNQFKYYPDYEGQYYGVKGNKHLDNENSDLEPRPEPIINPDNSFISLSSTQYISSQISLNNVIDVDVTQNINNNNINQNNNNNQINNTNNHCDGIMKNAYEQYDPNDSCNQQHKKQ